MKTDDDIDQDRHARLDGNPRPRDEHRDGTTSTIILAASESDPGSSASPYGNMENGGALTAPYKDMNGNEVEGSPTDSAAANVPGVDAAGNMDIENQGALSAPEKDAMGNPKATGGSTERAAANAPGADMEASPDADNQGSLSAPEKETGEM